MLVISHQSGDEGNIYLRSISEYAQKMQVKLKFIDHLIDHAGQRNNGKYTIGDIYNCADIVTYPSSYEGFGNAFLEAVYYKKPIVVHRYPVYIKDIEPRKFDVVAIEGFVTNKALQQINSILTKVNLRKKIVENNYTTAAKYFSYEVLEKSLLKLVNNFAA
jgi:glycosyltransferase involved in cell wall biosynthesis